MADLNFERKARVFQIVENALPSVKERVLRDFERMTFKTDEDFTEYLSETSALVDFKEEKGSPNKPNVINADVPVDKSKVSSNVNAFIDSKKADYQDPLGGRSGSEDPYQIK